jgi:hypothetical protein
MGKYDDLMAQYKKERQSKGVEAIPSPLKGMLSTANAATLGLGGQLYSVAGGAIDASTGGDFSEGYANRRDLIKSIEKSYKDEYPSLSIGTQLAASLPATIYNPLPLKSSKIALSGGQKLAQLVGNTGRVAATGAIYGGVSGVGNSDAYDIGGILADAQNAAATGSVMGAVSYPVALGIGGVGRNIYQRTALGQGALSGYGDKINNVLGGGKIGGGARDIYNRTLGANSASNYADLKVAEALMRDAEGKTFRSQNPSAVINNAGNAASTRMGKLPQGAPLANASGGNLLDLTDIAAITGGATKQAVSRKQHELMAKEAERMTSSAAKALGTGRPDYNETIEGFIQTAKTKSAPYYAQLNGYQYPIDDELRTVIKRASPFFGRSNLAATVDDLGGATLRDALNPNTRTISFDQLKILRQSLQSKEDKFMTSISDKDKDLGVRVSRLKNELTRKLDELSPKTPQGESVHALASGAYAGESKLRNAVENGRLIFREDAMNIRDSLKTMSQSEKDAFRLGVYQAIVDKTGRQSGRTELMNLYKDPAIADRLKAVFGKDYRKFASKLAAEFELRKFQKVAGGSQTATRQQGLNDLELSPLRDASEGAAALARGNVTGSMNPLTRLWQGVAVPESVRTNIGKTLLLEGAPAQAKLQSLNDLVQYINQQKQVNAMRFGSTFGQFQGSNNQ